MYRSSSYNIPIPLKGGGGALLFNTLSRAFAALDPDECASMAGFDGGAAPEGPAQTELLERLIINGFVVPADVDELARAERSYMAIRNDRAGLMLTIAPTLGCNFACDYCFQGQDKPTNLMSQEVMDATVDYVRRNLEGTQSFHVTWYGGEPLMGLGVIEQLSERFIALCDAQGATYGAAIVTNGYRLSTAVARRLRDCRVNTVQITLDGAQDDHDSRRHLLSKRGSFAKIVDNIASWIGEQSFAVHLRVNIDARNKEGIFGLIDELAGRGFGGKTVHMYFAPVEGTTAGCTAIADLTLGKSEYAELETSLFAYAYERKLSSFPFPPRFMGLCGAVRPRALVVTPSGDLHKCWDTVSFRHQRVGTILDMASLDANPLNAMWNAWSPFQNEPCRNCKILPTCAGACAYKFVHSAETRGEAAVLPCPSWKFNIKESLLHSAWLKGVIGKEQIPEGVVTNPEELCSFAGTGAGAALPDKIAAAKKASYAVAARAARSHVPA